ISDIVLDLDYADTLYFHLGGLRPQMSWRQLILGMGLHTAAEMETDGFRAYWTNNLRELASKVDFHDYWSRITSDGDLLGTFPSYTSIWDPLRSMDEGTMGLTMVACDLTMIDMDELARLHIYERLGDTWAWVPHGLERQQVAMDGGAQAD
ncbi:hypothetical protein Tco_0412794, partial [Tanacetum coccineum]